LSWGKGGETVCHPKSEFKNPDRDNQRNLNKLKQLAEEKQQAS
jgi:hypothetical protein